MPTLYRILAGGVVLFHLGFVLFVLLGGLLVWRWPRWAWAHLSAAVWGVWIELSGWICPLTPLENALSARGGEAGYSGGFVDHYLLPVLYPGALTRNIQFGLAGVVLTLNLAVYWRQWNRWRRGRAAARA